MTDPTTLPLRIARPHEAGALRDLARAAYARWVPVIGREPRPMQADYEEAVLIFRFDVIERDGRLVASLETQPRADHFWIESVVVAPELQGHGIGRRLLAHAEDLARAAGFSEVRLVTNGKMVANRQLYARVGYVEDLEEPFMDGTAVYMSKRL